MDANSLTLGMCSCGVKDVITKSQYTMSFIMNTSGLLEDMNMKEKEFVRKGITALNFIVDTKILNINGGKCCGIPHNCKYLNNILQHLSGNINLLKSVIQLISAIFDLLLKIKFTTSRQKLQYALYTVLKRFGSLKTPIESGDILTPLVRELYKANKELFKDF